MPFDFTTRRNICPTEAGGGGSSILTDVTIPPSVVSQTIYPQEGFDGFNKVVVPAVPLESIAINPSTFSQSFAPSGENLGFNTITVNPVTASIDPNITAGNLKRGVSILGINGAIDVGSAYNTTFEQIYGVVDENGIMHKSETQMDVVFDGIKRFTPGVLDFKWYRSNIINSVTCPDAEYINGFSNAFMSDYYNSTPIASFIAPNAKYLGGMNGSFTSCSKLTNFYCPNVVTINQSGLSYAFNGVRNTTASQIHLDSLAEVQQNGMSYAFNNSSIYLLNFTNLKRLYQNAFSGIYYGFPYYMNSSWEFPKLYAVADNGLSRCFDKYGTTTSNGHIYFPALIPDFYKMYTTTIKNNSFASMLKNTANLTVHFPSNLEPIINTWDDVVNGFGSSSATILFDLPNALEPENEYVIDNGVLTNYAFSRLPLDFSGVHTIEDDVLSFRKGYLGSVNTIVFPDLVTCGNNSFNYAFTFSENLTNFYAPNLTTIGNDCFFYSFYNCNNLISINMPSLKDAAYNNSATYAYKSSGLYYAAAYCPNLQEINLASVEKLWSVKSIFEGSRENLTTVNLHNLTYINDPSNSFNGCTNLTNLDLSSLVLENSFNTQYMFNGCINLTNISCGLITDLFGTGTNASDYKPANRMYMFADSGITEANFYNLSNKAHYAYANNTCAKMFYNCHNLTTVDLSKFKGMGSTGMVVQNVFNHTFENCSNLVSVDMSGIISMPYNYMFYGTFKDCPNLTFVNFNNLKEVGRGWGNRCFYETFQNDISLESICFPNLTYAGVYNCFVRTFYGCTNLKDVYFNKLTSTQNCFRDMFVGCNDVNLHIPSALNIQSFIGYPLFGGTNITIMKDL